MQDKKAKILFIMQLYPPIHGASTVGEQIKNSAIINDNFDCRFIRISTKSIKGKSNIVTQIANYFFLICKILSDLIKNKYDAIYIAPCASGLEFFKDYLICLLAKLFCKKIIYHFHNKGISNNKYLNKFILKTYFKNVHVILSSKYLKYDIEPYVKDKNVTYLPYGISDKATVKRKTKTINDVPVILFFAHLMKEKGAIVLLESLKILHEKNLDFRCNFVGGSYDININDFNLLIKNYNLTKKVKFLGPKYNREKDKVFLESDVFAFPTYYRGECFPLGILEAMKFGLPIITTNEGAIKEMVIDKINGYIIEKNDSKDLSEKLELLILNQGTRAAFGYQSLQFFSHSFTLDVFLSNFGEALKKLSA